MVAGQVSGTITTKGLSWSCTIEKTMNSALSSTTSYWRPTCSGPIEPVIEDHQRPGECNSADLRAPIAA